MRDEDPKLARRDALRLLLCATYASACRSNDVTATAGDGAAPVVKASAGAEGAVATLLAAAHVWIPHPIEVARYKDFLEWRSKVIPAAKTIYEEVAGKLDAEARGGGASTFLAADEAKQKAAVERLAGDTRTSDVRGDLLRVFAATDAWKVLGYDSHPASPRGQEAYKTMIVDVAGAPDGGKRG